MSLLLCRYFAIKMWYLEKHNFTYGSTNNDLHVVGHYTQMVWASSHKVGCGFTKCGSRGRTYYSYICNYCPMWVLLFCSYNVIWLWNEHYSNFDAFWPQRQRDGAPGTTVRAGKALFQVRRSLSSQQAVHERVSRCGHVGQLQRTERHVARLAVRQDLARITREAPVLQSHVQLQWQDHLTMPPAHTLLFLTSISPPTRLQLALILSGCFVRGNWTFSRGLWEDGHRTLWFK